MAELAVEQIQNNATAQLFQTFFHGAFSPFEITCLRSFVDHGHRVRVYAYDHATTPDFCERADARTLLPEDRVFHYRTGFGAGSVSGFSNLFRYTMLLRHGGWWIDTDVACLSATWPGDEIVAAPEDDQRIATAVLRFPPGHPVMAAAVAACEAAGDSVNWGQTGPELLTRLLRGHNLSLKPANLFYPLHWSEWLDLLDPAGAAGIAARSKGAVALHLWNEKFRHYGFQPALAPPPGSFLHGLATRHGTIGHFAPAEPRAQQRQIAQARAQQETEAAASRPPRFCVYTALTGRYETLNEQPAANSSAIPFICFSDDPDQTSKTWQIRPLHRILPADSIRSQRDYKMRPHRYLPDFDISLYIDNSVLLKTPPEAIFAAVDLSAGLSLLAHSYRATLLDEFARVADRQLDDPARIAEQRAYYQAEHPEILTQRPFWGAILLRDHRNATMIAAMEYWFAQILRYTRRDQLSSRVAFAKAGLVPQTLHFDNYGSWFHSWPHETARNHAMRRWRGPAAADVRLAELQARHDQLAQAHDALLASTSWRALQPLRSAIDYLRKARAS